MLFTHDRTLGQLKHLCRQAPTARDLMRDASNLLSEGSDAAACVMLRPDPLSAMVVDSYEPRDLLERCTAFREITFLRCLAGDFCLQAQGRQRVMELSEDLADHPFVEHGMRPFGYRGELAVNLASLSPSCAA